MQSRLVLLVLQLVFINLVLVVGASLNMLLPRILNVLLPYFVVPIALVAGFRVLAQWMLGTRASQAPTMVFGIVAATAWLGLTLGAYLDVFDYPALRLGRTATALSPGDIETASGSSMVSFTSGVVAADALGLARESTRVKSGDTTTTVRHTYTAVPFVEADWRPGQPVPAWFCLWASGRKKRTEAEVFADALETIPGLGSRSAPLVGIAIRDAATIDHCESAIDDAGKRRGVTSAKGALLLRYSPGDMPALISRSARRFWIYVALCNFLWLMPVFLVRLSPPSNGTEQARP